MPPTRGSLSAHYAVWPEEEPVAHELQKSDIVPDSPNLFVIEGGRRDEVRTEEAVEDSTPPEPTPEPLGPTSVVFNGDTLAAIIAKEVEGELKDRLSRPGLPANVLASMSLQAILMQLAFVPRPGLAFGFASGFTPSLPQGCVDMTHHANHEMLRLHDRKFGFMVPQGSKLPSPFSKPDDHDAGFANACIRDAFIDTPDFFTGHILTEEAKERATAYDLYFLGTWFVHEEGYEVIGGVRFNETTGTWYGISRLAATPWDPVRERLVIHEDAKLKKGGEPFPLLKLAAAALIIAAVGLAIASA